MAGRVPDSVLAVEIQRQGRWAARVRDLAAGGASQRDIDLAVDLEERQWLGVVVRHAQRCQYRQRVETSRARAVHRCASADRAAPAGQPTAEDAGSWSLDRRRSQICGDAVVDADGDGESGLRT